MLYSVIYEFLVINMTCWEIADPGVFSHETSHSLVGSSAANASVEIGAFHHDFILGRNPVAPQSFHGTSTQSVRGVRSSYSHQRSTPTFRASSSTMRVGHVGSSEEGMQLVAESYSSGHPRPLSSLAWRHSDRSGRSRISHDRHRSLAEEPSLHERFSSEVCTCAGILLLLPLDRVYALSTVIRKIFVMALFETIASFHWE